MTAHVAPSSVAAAAGSDLAVEIAGAELVLDPAGAVWWPAARALLVADLHLEKGSSLATRGTLLPPYDTAATLARLAALIARHAPAIVIALGDSFHDAGGPARLMPCDAARLADLQRGRDWVWIAGNHDPIFARDVGGEQAAELALGPLTLRHHPAPGAAPGELAGHLHPAAKVCGRGRGVRRRCFATDGRRIVLPAFGAYAGGLNVLDVAFARLFAWPSFAAVMLGDARVHPIRHVRLRPD